jgi:hypothetical protein
MERIQVQEFPRSSHGLDEALQCHATLIDRGENAPRIVSMKTFS